MDIIRGSARKPVSTERLVEIIEREFDDTEGVLYVGYPILSSSDEAVSIDALLIARRHGVIAISLVEGRDAGQYGELQDDVASLLESKFKQHKSLRAGRNLLAVPETITYAPMCTISEDDSGHRLISFAELSETCMLISDRALVGRPKKDYKFRT